MARKQAEPELPAAVEAEKLVLGSVLLDGEKFREVATALKIGDFTLVRHQRIFARMHDLDGRGEKIDRVTVANELKSRGELEPDGFSYIVSLDDNLPLLPNIDSYCRILKEKSARRRLAAIGNHVANLAMAGESDAASIARDAGTVLGQIGDDGADDDGMTVEEMVAAFEGGVNAFLDPSRNPPGIATGFRRLDGMLGGMKPGELVVVGARPSVGKTALAANIAWHAAVNLNIPTEFFSMEMRRKRIVDRLLAASARVDCFRLRHGGLEPDERMAVRTALTRLMDSPLRIHERTSVSAGMVRSSVRRRKAKLAIVDYLQLMTADGRFENRNTEISHITRAFKLLAKDEDLPVMILSQLRRPQNGAVVRRPELSDLRDSGSIESDADIVILLHREVIGRRSRGQDDGPTGNQAEVILAKQRDGATGVIQMLFSGPYILFEEAEVME